MHFREPAPSGYEVIQIADVGYMYYGSFCRLFSAALPETHPSNSRGVPENFFPIIFDEGDKCLWRQPRPPAALHSNSIQIKGVDAGLSTNQRGNVQFESTAAQGAILLTNDKTYRADTLQKGLMEEYGIRNIDYWLEFAQRKGHGVKMKDIMFVTGFDVTTEYAMAAFSDANKNISLEFQAKVPLASTNASVWGSWVTTSSVHYNCGPQVRIPPSPTANLNSSTMGEALQSQYPVDNQLRKPPKGYNQCVFVRRFRFERKMFRRVPKVIKAAAGPHDLGSGDRHKDSAPMAGCDNAESDSSDGDAIMTIADSPPVRNHFVIGVCYYIVLL
ncbi:hypothetical protein BU17DRAFT_40032 [Hysterangium stoloniferum]|nr:hypothetical protein BU17DRAFT_40032 [Hysterangium stoloniferum]